MALLYHAYVKNAREKERKMREDVASWKKFHYNNGKCWKRKDKDRDGKGK